MNDPFFMSRGQPMCNLQRIVESLAHGKRSAAQPLPQRLAFQQFGDYVGRAFARADIEDCQNVGMVQGSSGQSLLLKAAQAVDVERKRLGQSLDGYFTFQARVAGSINLAHASRA